MSLISVDRLLRNFPHKSPRRAQTWALQEIAKSKNGVLIELPTGEGKTDIGMAALLAFSEEGKGPLFYVTPTKLLVDQLRQQHPGKVTTVFGRAEYPCLYYVNRGQNLNAMESPCYMLQCDHRVSQETGETEVPGADPCPYFLDKWNARRRAEEGNVVVCTTAFFLMNRMFVKEWKDKEPELVVVDEAHRLADITRRLFEYELTDYHLLRLARILREIDRGQAAVLLNFVRTFRRLARKRSSQQKVLLKDEEIERLLGIADDLSRSTVEKKVRQAVRDGKLDTTANRTELKMLENLIHNIPRLLHMLRLSLESEGRRPLNYVVAFYYREDDPAFANSQKQARYHLTVKSYYVRPLIQKALGPRVVAYSATIGEPRVFGFETGIEPATHPFHSFPSEFPIEQTRLYLPTDTPNLAAKARRRDDVKKVMRRIVSAAKQFAEKGSRSLVIVVSEEERQKFLKYAGEGGLKTVSYGNGTNAMRAAASFKDGEGEALVGTAAQYAEGVDLPDGSAPVIFFLRPGYPHPDDPQAQFEQKRFSEGQYWALWNWRVMMQAMQARGRNIRSRRDKGVCFFVSQQFHRFIYSGLPEWLKPAYRYKLTFDASVADALKMLGNVHSVR